MHHRIIPYYDHISFAVTFAMDVLPSKLGSHYRPFPLRKSFEIFQYLSQFVRLRILFPQHGIISTQIEGPRAPFNEKKPFVSG